MSYDFSFDRKTFTLLLGGFAFVGIMLFIAGLLVGTNWETEQPAVASAVTGVQTPAAAPAPAPVPTEPVIREPAARPGPETSDEMTEPAADPAPAQQAHSPASPAVTKESLRAQPYEGGGEMKIVERAQSPAPEAAESNKTGQSSFSVQVAVFVDEKDANQLVRQLQGKGYTPFVLATGDGEARTWYAVRIGTYTDRAEAERAATNIAAQEKIKTFVRPLGSL